VPAAASLLWDPLGTAADGAARLQFSVSLVRRACPKRSCMERDDLHQEPRTAAASRAGTAPPVPPGTAACNARLHQAIGPARAPRPDAYRSGGGAVRARCRCRVYAERQAEVRRISALSAQTSIAGVILAADDQLPKQGAGTESRILILNQACDILERLQKEVPGANCIDAIVTCFIQRGHDA
jgi:hypothetical protein